MSNRATILESVIGHAKGEMSPELARYLLSLDFPPSAQTRYAELVARAQEGSLTDEERAELEDFLNVNDFLTIVQSKARIALGGKSSAASLRCALWEALDEQDGMTWQKSSHP